MKILQIVHSSPLLNQAGTELHTYNLSLELAKKHQVYIFARVCNPKQKDYEITKENLNGITVYLINNTFKYCNSFEMYYQNDEIDKRFTELLDKIMPDIVHIQHLVFLSIGLMKIISDRGIPLVFSLHDYWLMCPRWHLLKNDFKPCDKAVMDKFDEECLDCLSEILNIKKGAKRVYTLGKRLLPRPIIEHLKKMYFLSLRISDNDNGITKLKERNYKIKDSLNRVNIFFAPSKYLKDKFIKFGITSRKINFLQNGLDGDLFMDIQKTKANKIRFAFIGTILPAKGLHTLINSFNGIKSDDAELKIYGKLYSYIGFEYYPPYLKKIIKNKNIKFMGEFNHQEVANIFKEIDVLVVPSIWDENSPLVIQEAFATQTPVIASRIGGIPELINDRKNGLLFEPGNPDDLYDKMNILINDPHLIKRLKDGIIPPKSIQENALEIEELYMKGN